MKLGKNNRHFWNQGVLENLNIMKINPTFFMLITTNALVYLNFATNLEVERSDFQLRSDFVTLNLPVKTLFKFSKKKGSSGIPVEIKTSNGDTISENAIVYSKDPLATNKKIIVTVQLPQEDLNKIPETIEKDIYFLISPQATNKKRRREDDKAKEIFL
tara:strand:- start:633 stop:1109 length:477 start_codon:yes stop_codon:yes gene_type:complete